MKKLINYALLVCISVFCLENVKAQTYDFEDKLVPLTYLDTDDHFSEFDAVSIDGNYAVVGAQGSDLADDDCGIAFLYNWNDTLCYWRLIDTISAQQGAIIPDLDEFSGFGWSVVIRNKIIAIGAPGYNTGGTFGGRVYIYKVVDEEAVFVQRIQAWHNDETDDSQNGARFGIDLDFDGLNLIVSAIGETNAEPTDPSITDAGAAYIYNWDGTDFDFITKIYAPERDVNDSFGTSVGIDGNFAVVGAEFEDEDSDEDNTVDNAGSAYVFKFNSGSGEWEFFQKLVAPSTERQSGDLFGSSVDISQVDIVIGAPNEDHDETGSDPLSNPGSIYTYNFTTGFMFYQKLVASDRDDGDNFGAEVKIYSNTILVGAPNKNMGMVNQVGQAYTFVRDGTWAEDQIFTANIPSDIAHFGEAIDLDYKRVIIGEPLASLDEDDNTSTKNNFGAAYIYDIEFHPYFIELVNDQVGQCSEDDIITFTVSGNLNDAYGWEWYEDGCDGTYLGAGDSITLELEDTTRICVRAVECFNYVDSLDCHCMDVYISDDHWHQKTDYGLEEIPSETVTDAEGNIYTTGIYRGFAQFNGGDNTSVLADDMEPGTYYHSKVFVSKYDNCGNLLWVAYAIGDETNDYSNGIALKESEDVLYIVGEFTDEITIMNGQGDEGIGSGSFTLTDLGTVGGFVAQINREDGEINFIEKVNSSLKYNRLTAVAVNENNGDLYVGGQTYADPGYEKVFIRKYQPSFSGLSTHHWEEISLPEKGAIINGMDYDGTSPSIDDMGSLWFIGTFKEEIRFSVIDPLLSSGLAVTDAFVGKLEEYNGGISDDYVVREFVKKGNIFSLAANEMEGNDIDTDPATGNAYITGNKIGQVEDAFGMSGEDLLTVSGNHVGYFVAMQYDGGIPSPNLSEITYPDPNVYATGDAVVVKNNIVYFTGSRNDDISFGDDDPILEVDGSGTHLYIVAYDLLDDCEYKWANGTLNPDVETGAVHLPFSIAANNEGHAYIAGHFWLRMGYIDGSPSSGELTYTSNGGSLFIMRVDIEGDGEEALEFTLPDENVGDIGDFEQINLNNQLSDDNYQDQSRFIKLYPNPTNGNAILSISNEINGDLTISIYSIDGKQLQQKRMKAGNIELNVSDFGSGIYIIKVNGLDFNQQLNLIKNN